MDKFNFGISLSIVGMGTVFLVLFFLQMTMNMESWLFKTWLSKPEKESLKNQTIASETTNLPASFLDAAAKERDLLSPQLIAVITAAISYQIGRPSQPFRLVNVRKASDREASSPWSFQGRTDLINSRANFYARGGSK